MKQNIKLSKELANGKEQVWNLKLDGDTVTTENGLKGKTLKEYPKTYEIGKAGRTPEQEAVINAHKKVVAKLEAGYTVVSGSVDKLAKANDKVHADVQKAKEKAKAEKAKEKERAKAEKAAAKAKAKAEAELVENDVDEDVEEEEVDLSADNDIELDDEDVDDVPTRPYLKTGTGADC